MDHDAINKVMCARGYGKGAIDNPYGRQCKEWDRRITHAKILAEIQDKIVSLFEPRFITPPETSELIQSLITMTDSRNILELGTHTGFTTLHMLSAIIGKPGAKVVSIDCRPAHDAEFFAKPEIAPHFEHIAAWTPDCLTALNGRNFDFVFIDSDHTVDHTEKEIHALLSVTIPGAVFLFHDCPKRQTPDAPANQDGPIFVYLHEKVKQGVLRGTIFPTAEQLDCLSEWGAGYPKECNPHLGMFIRI